MKTMKQIKMREYFQEHNKNDPSNDYVQSTLPIYHFPCNYQIVSQLKKVSNTTL